MVADPKATDQNKGTKPVFEGVNPVVATTAGIFAVFGFGSGAGIRTLNPAVNTSLRPVQKQHLVFAECRRLSLLVDFVREGLGFTEPTDGS